MRLRRSLGIGSGLQVEWWSDVSADQFVEVGARLLKLGDEAYSVSADAGANIHDAARRLDDALRNITGFRERLKHLDELTERNQSVPVHPEELRTTVEGCVRSRDFALDLFRRVYEHLADADADLERAVPRWYSAVQGRRTLAPPPFRSVANLVAQTLEGAEPGDEPPSEITAEWERVRAVATQPIYFHVPRGGGRTETRTNTA